MDDRPRSLTLILVFSTAAILASCVAAANLERSAGQPCVGARGNQATRNVVQGSSRNRVSPRVTGATVNGGGDPAFPHEVTGDYGAIGGGLGNEAGNLAAVAGGSHNAARGLRAVVGGGNGNVASGPHSFIGGGESNAATNAYTTIGGGNFNTATRRNATVGGGSGNTASFSFATVAGGDNNVASGLESTVAGGTHNLAGGTYAAIGGGSGNRGEALDATVSGGSGNSVTGEEGTIGGGLVNQVTDKYSTVGGGRGNLAGSPDDNPLDAQYSTVGGGIENRASGLAASIGGGANNIASGAYSTVPGGTLNQAAGNYSVASGRRANVRSEDDGTWLYADSSNVEFYSQSQNEFAARATGGVRFVTAVDAAGNPTAGVQLPAGGGSWESLSDRNVKVNLGPVDAREILRRVAELPLSTFRYKTEAGSIRHIGPMAQDFHAAFAVGEDARYISTLDADGVALAAIQGLDQMVRERDERIKTQQEEFERQASQIASQQSEIEALQAHLARLESRVAGAATPSPSVYGPTLPWIVLGGLSLGSAWRRLRRSSIPTVSR